MEILITIAVWTLAFYGLFELIKGIINIFICTKLHTDGIYFIIAVKNQENNIEMFFRNLMFKIIYGRENCIKNVLVVDLNSTDNTKEILEKLQKDYEEIKILNFKECKDLIENMNDVQICKNKGKNTL